MYNYNDILHKRRPISRHVPMSIGHRAKIFAPFAALSGFETCVHAKEERYTAQVELPPEKEEELDRRLRLLRYQDQVSAVYFVHRSDPSTEDTDSQGKPTGQYNKISGPLEWIHPMDRCLKISSVEINFDDLLDLQC